MPLPVKLFRKCLAAIEPRHLISQKIQVTNSTITICNDTHLPLTSATKIVVIGFGKAVLGMARGVHDALTPHHPPTATILIASHYFHQQGSTIPPPNTMVHYAAPNNIPDQRSVDATNEVIGVIRGHDSPHTIFLFLVSGGGSALLCAPRSGLTFEDKQHTQDVLFRHGATIHQVNNIRQRLSMVKRGKLVDFVKMGKAVSLIISDVVGDNLETIASGPTYHPPSTTQHTISYSTILDTLQIDKSLLRPAVLRVLDQDDQDDTIAPSTHTIARNYIVASNQLALTNIKHQLDTMPIPFHTQIVTTTMQGATKAMGEHLAQLILSADTMPRHHPIAMLFGGETSSVVVAGGKGGRAQEMALVCLANLVGKLAPSSRQFFLLCAGTDGQDGPTDAAGVLLFNRAVRDSPDIKTCLDSSNSYNFWQNHLNGECHLKTGPTGTNVMDICILLIF